ncbi:MAG: hypothetical protein R3D59_16920 [Paracoccaceae bacterium]
MAEDTPSTPSERWLAAHHAGDRHPRPNGRVLLDLARADRGRVVLPTYAGDGSAGVVRVSPASRGLPMTNGSSPTTRPGTIRRCAPLPDAVAQLLTDTSLRPPLARGAARPLAPAGQRVQATAQQTRQGRHARPGKAPDDRA